MCFWLQIAWDHPLVVRIMVMLVSSVGHNKRGRLVTCSGVNIWWKLLFGSYIPRRRLESVITMYSKHPHRCGDWHMIRFICAGAMSEYRPRKEDNSAHSCNCRSSNKDGDKEAKFMDFAALISVSCQGDISHSSISSNIRILFQLHIT